jgi:hypothetical protein
MVAAGMAAKIRSAGQTLAGADRVHAIAVFFTQSRSSYLAFVPALLVLGFMTERRLIIVGLLSVGLLSPLFLPAIVKDRILYTFNQPEEPADYDW